ncbi:hypothetical protein HN358_00280 [Candidatus Uhrbacteria bacterium]|jgi:uncharacterized membrane protein|nr:hypothetical protein [Candidatus Uhrbacteria bacterium]MBT7717721.1 hypothetical protein [Candidatus Uhrbacteria bacterium]
MLNTKTFSDGAAIRFGWEKMKEHLGFFIIMFLVMIGAAILPMILGIFISEDYWYLSILLFLAYFVLATIMGVGFIQIVLDITDGKKPVIATLFTRWNVFFKYLGVMIVYGFVVYVGFFLLIFPGVIWSLKYWFAPLLVVDKGMGPIEAMKKSSEMTMGLKWDLLGFYSVTSVVNVIGMLCLYVGLVFTAPTTMIAMTKVYREVS